MATALFSKKKEHGMHVATTMMISNYNTNKNDIDNLGEKAYIFNWTCSHTSAYQFWNWPTHCKLLKAISLLNGLAVKQQFKGTRK